jgi:hypothetical protein
MDLFERLDQGRPKPEPKPINQPSKDHAQRLLDFIQRWREPTIYTRDILIFGPPSVRNRKNMIDATETLVRHGWLVPQKTKQSNWRLWQIVRRPTVHPKLAD